MANIRDRRAPVAAVAVQLGEAAVVRARRLSYLRQVQVVSGHVLCPQLRVLLAWESRGPNLGSLWVPLRRLLLLARSASQVQSTVLSGPRETLPPPEFNLSVRFRATLASRTIQQTSQPR